MAGKRIASMLSIVVGLFLVAPFCAAADPDAQAKNSLDRGVPELRLHGESLSDTNDFLRDISGVPFVVDWNALARVGVKKTSPVTVDAKNLKFSQAITMILDSASQKPGAITYAVKNAAIHIAPK
jgi:hypothetical protein